jgi:hypothetical protein
MLCGKYPRLFRAFVREYNWAYDDHLGEIPFIQQSFLFTLYPLTRYAGEWRSSIFYEDNFLRAFPNLLPQVQPVGNYYSSEQVVRLSYSVSCLERFACFFGLVEIEHSGSDRYTEEFRVRKLPLLDEIVQFHLSGHYGKEGKTAYPQVDLLEAAKPEALIKLIAE